MRYLQYSADLYCKQAQSSIGHATQLRAIYMKINQILQSKQHPFGAIYTSAPLALQYHPVILHRISKRKCPLRACRTLPCCYPPEG